MAEPEVTKTIQGFFDSTTGEPVEDSDGGRVTSAYLRGTIAPKKGTQVPIVHPETGKVVNVAAEDLQTALAQGAALPSPDQVKYADAEARLGTEAHGILPTILHTLGGPGAARGLTGGISDKIAVEAGNLYNGAEGKHKVQQYLNDIKTVHPLASAISELGGAAAGAYAGGALGGAARLLPIAAIDAVGGGAAALGEGTAISALGRGFAGRVAGGIAGGALRGGAEGALFGIAQQVDEHTLGNDPNLTAEKLLAAAGHGALTGAAAGSFFGGLGALGREGFAAAAPKLKEAADELTIRAFSGNQKDVARMAKIGGGNIKEGTAKVAEYARVNGIVGMGQTVEDIVPKVKADFVTRVKELLGFHANYGTHATIETDTFLKRIVKEVAEPLLNDPARKVYGQRVANYVTDMAEKFGVKDAEGVITHTRPMTLEEAWELRKGLDRTVNFDAVDPGIATAEKIKMRGIFEDSIENGIDTFQAKLKAGQGEKAIANENNGLLQQYKKLKENYRIAAVLNDAVEKAEIRNMRNNMFSLRDNMFGGAAAVAGSVLSGNPLGAAAGIATGVIANQARRRGVSTAAVLADKLGQLGVLKRAVGDVDNIVNKGVGGFFSNLGARGKAFRPAASFTGKGGLDAMFKAAVENTQDQQKPDYEQQINHLASQTQHLTSVAPNAQQAVVGNLTRTTGFLQSKLPQDTSKGFNAQKYSQLSDQKKQSFLLSYRASTDPLSVVADMQRGSVAPEQIEALKVNYPGLYSQLQQTVLEHVATQRAKGNTIPYQKLATLSVLFGTTEIDPSFAPERVAMLQQSIQPAAPPQKNPVGRPSSKPVDGISKLSSYSTQISRLNKAL